MSFGHCTKKQQVDLILPQDLLQVVKDRIESQSRLVPSYYRVIMTLGQILQGNFFTEYIKIGDLRLSLAAWPVYSPLYHSQSGKQATLLCSQKEESMPTTSFL